MAGRITVELPEEPVPVRCDRVRAVQCLSNLLANAEKYTPADSPIEIRAEVTGTQVHIHVRDHGPGIPVSEQARVFERFYRREDPFTMRTGGAGPGPAHRPRAGRRDGWRPDAADARGRPGS